MSKAKASENVQVVVRCRPLNRRETEDRRLRVVDMDLRTNLISLRNPKDERETPKQFTFDKIYDWNSKQVDVVGKSPGWQPQQRVHSARLVDLLVAMRCRLHCQGTDRRGHWRVQWYDLRVRADGCVSHSKIMQL